MASGAVDPQCLEPIFAAINSFHLSSQSVRVCVAWRDAVLLWRMQLQADRAEQQPGTER
jgi:hypothetical protein